MTDDTTILNTEAVPNSKLIAMVLNWVNDVRKNTGIIYMTPFKHVSRPAVYAFLRPWISASDGMREPYQRSGLRRRVLWVSS